MTQLTDVKVGDTVTRMLAGVIPMELTVTNATGTRITCGPWEFDRRTGAEVDEDLGWDSAHSGSYIST